MKCLKYPSGIFAIFLNSLPYLAGPNQVQGDAELPPGAGDTLWNDPLLKQISPPARGSTNAPPCPAPSNSARSLLAPRRPTSSAPICRSASAARQSNRRRRCFRLIPPVQVPLLPTAPRSVWFCPVTLSGSDSDERGTDCKPAHLHPSSSTLMNRLIDSPEAIGGKRRQGQASLRECAGKRLKKQKQKHLYLVLDD
ncbi:uncharacterized protein LOC124697571 [Lolium rigidum]|uniref:uncharacterized protein LOC124697571 n=1 Tax=Lolium rigidum TaxID=89674 RepID=UPI001F5D341D|nr:uncharacterized protein LOC124697571 [Lolium rigidum]